MTVVYQKEIKTYRYSLLSYLLIAGFLLFIGIYTMALNLSNGLPNFEYALNGGLMMMLIFIPVLTMSILANERRNRTDRLLYGSVIPMRGIVMGKFLAAFTVFMIPVLLFCFYPLILASYGRVHFISAYTGILALIFLGAALIAIGIFVSSLTDSQSVAAVCTFGSLLLSWMMPTLYGYISSSPRTSFIGWLMVLALLCLALYANRKQLFLPLCIFAVGGTALSVLFIAAPHLFSGTIKTFLSYFALFSPFEVFVYGLVKLPSLVYYASVTVLFLFFSARSMERRESA